MDSRNKYIQQEYLEITFFIIFGIIMTIIIPIFFGFVGTAFEESFSGGGIEIGSILGTYIIYYILIVSALIGLPLLKIRELLLTQKGEHPGNQKNPKLVSVAYIHDPSQDGLLYNIGQEVKSDVGYNFMRWSIPIWRMFLIFSIIFIFVGIIQAITSFQFVGIPQIGFQVTPLAEIFFTAEPPAFAETMTMVFILSLLMGINGYFTSRFNLGKWVYFVIGISIVSPLIGASWMGFHNIAYGNDEASLFATFIFGLVGSWLTILFGSFIPWYLWHFWNNFFVKASIVFESVSEDIIFFGFMGLILLIILWVGIELFIKRLRITPEEPKTPN